MSHSILVHDLTELATPEGTSARCGAAQGQLRVVPDAAILIDDGLIAFAGPERELRERFPDFRADEEIDGRGCCALPGFVDSHTHLPFAGDRSDEFGRRLKGASYREIAAAGGGILSTVEATRAASVEELEASCEDRLARMLAHGTTTVEAKSGYGLEIATELKQLRALAGAASRFPGEVVATALPLHEIPPEVRVGGPEARARWLKTVDEELLPAIVAEGLAEFADVFCEDGIYTPDESRRHLLKAARLGLRPRIHADEAGRVGRLGGGG